MQAPYYAVIFTSTRNEGDQGYAELAQKMEALAQEQPGFLGMESAREHLGITVSYWENVNAITQWKKQLDHTEAQRKGRATWYSGYRVRICKVEKEYSFGETSF
jgi:heme-degrading monooxygenase HmoA